MLCSDICPTYGPVFGPLGLQAGGQLHGMDDIPINTLPPHILELDVSKMLWVTVPLLCHTLLHQHRGLLGKAKLGFAAVAPFPPF